MSRTIRFFHAALICTSVTAFAEKPRVVVVPLGTGDGVSDASATRFQRVLADELKSRADALELVTPAARTAAASPDKPAPRRGPNPEAVAALEVGRKAFDELRFDEATVNLKKAIDGLLADPLSVDFETIVDAQVKLAASWFRMGEEKDAKATLLDLVRLSPNYELPSGFPPVFQRELDKARKRLAKQARGQLVIDGPPGCTVFVNGRDLGMVPVTEELPAGAHYVRVENAKGERFGAVADVRPGTTRLKATFGGAGTSQERSVVKPGDAPDPRSPATIDEPARDKITTWAKLLNADFALAVWVSKTADTQLTAGSALISVKKNTLVSLMNISFDTDVMTANTEVFKLADDLVKKLTNPGTSATLPLTIAAAKKAPPVVATTKVGGDDVDAASPNGNRPPPKKVVLVPQPETDPKTAPLVQPPAASAEVKGSGVPVWVWVVAGVAVAAGAGVGGYFGIREATRPVSGTVTASW